MVRPQGPEIEQPTFIGTMSPRSLEIRGAGRKPPATKPTASPHHPSRRPRRIEGWRSLVEVRACLRAFSNGLPTRCSESYLDVANTKTGGSHEDIAFQTQKHHSAARRVGLGPPSDTSLSESLFHRRQTLLKKASPTVQYDGLCDGLRVLGGLCVSKNALPPPQSISRRLSDSEGGPRPTLPSLTFLRLLHFGILVEG